MAQVDGRKCTPGVRVRQAETRAPLIPLCGVTRRANRDDRNIHAGRLESLPAEPGLSAPLVVRALVQRRLPVRVGRGAGSDTTRIAAWRSRHVQGRMAQSVFGEREGRTGGIGARRYPSARGLERTRSDTCRRARDSAGQGGSPPYASGQERSERDRYPRPTSPSYQVSPGFAAHSIPNSASLTNVGQPVSGSQPSICW